MYRFLSHILILIFALFVAVPGAPTPTPEWETGRNVKSARLAVPQEPVKLVHASTSLKIIDDASTLAEMADLVVPHSRESFVAPRVTPISAEISLPSSARASPASA